MDVAASVDVAVMASVPDLDNATHLDSQSRASGDHGEALRPAHVRLAPH
jgi:hypothetical protein